MKLKVGQSYGQKVVETTSELAYTCSILTH
jgi:hypothetical protein